MKDIPVREGRAPSSLMQTSRPSAEAPMAATVKVLA